ncbi:MAG: 16S rRNA (guanine(527)-N(7))-methyltransferase RsmG [Blastocatellia bacterium]|nr:16S rRNA (guanine(527)-N(7))-methyltransferase RsmG [Blastocatellia bacterium]
METSVRQFEILLPEAGFSPAETALLSRYYAMVLKWNPRLHLTTITEPGEFLARHVLESAFAARQLLPDVRAVWDIGSGLGIPGMVIAILRPDLTLHLVEAGKKKALFLEEAAAALPLPNVRVVPRRFESLPPLPEDACLTARAVEEMAQLLPQLIDMATGARQILLLGGFGLAEGFKSAVAAGWEVQQSLIPGSERRLLLSAARST